MRTLGWYIFQLVLFGSLFLIHFLADRLLLRLFSGYRGKRRLLFWLIAAGSGLVFALARTSVFREAEAESVLRYFIYGMVVWDIAIAGLVCLWPVCWLAGKLAGQLRLPWRFSAKPWYLTPYPRHLTGCGLYRCQTLTSACFLILTAGPRFCGRSSQNSRTCCC